MSVANLVLKVHGDGAAVRDLAEARSYDEELEALRTLADRLRALRAIEDDPHSRWSLVTAAEDDLTDALDLVNRVQS